MIKSNEARILTLIARQHGITEKEVRNEIQEAIDQAMLSDDPAQQVYWASLFKNNKRPSPEEFIRFVSKSLAKT